MTVTAHSLQECERADFVRLPSNRECEMGIRVFNQPRKPA